MTFKKGDYIVWHAGNWKYDVLFSFLGFLILRCAEDDCECCSEWNKRKITIRKAVGFMDYEEWCDHGDGDGCDICT